MNLVYRSVCSGIEAASVAWHPLGWRAESFSEIEKFPRTVLQHHYPDVPLHGDFTTAPEPTTDVDVLVGGTPCQSFSVAGKRLGLDDPRGHLTLAFLALARRIKSKWIVWENVPGVLSDDGGRTFGTLLGVLGQLGYGFAYRILDAQYFGVPQRRRRVFVIACLGGWRSAAAVLFERESLLGYPSQGGEARQDVAPTISARTKGGGGLGTDFDCDGGLIAHALNAKGGSGRSDFESEEFVTFEANVSMTSPLEGNTYQTITRRTHCSILHNGVRRITPRECERLQGFPDDYTLIPFRGKPAADGPRYKALGNSMAVPVMRWIGERIDAIESALRSQ